MSKLDEKAQELRKNLGLDSETEKELGSIEMDVLTGFTLADAIRQGSTVSAQAYAWGDGTTACALTAAVIGAKANGYL